MAGLDLSYLWYYEHWASFSLLVLWSWRHRESFDILFNFCTDYNLWSIWVIAVISLLPKAMGLAQSHKMLPSERVLWKTEMVERSAQKYHKHLKTHYFSWSPSIPLHQVANEKSLNNVASCMKSFMFAYWFKHNVRIRHPAHRFVLMKSFDLKELL